MTSWSGMARLRGLRGAMVGLGVVGVLAAVVGLTSAISWLDSTSNASRADPRSVAQVALGQEVYARRCAACHGKRLEGQADWQVRKPDGRLPAPPHDETGHTWHHTDQQLFDITKLGLAPFAPPNYQSDMPAFGGVLTDDEIWAVVAFMKSTWPAEIQAHQRRITERTRDER